jgi:hypothetical protein
MIYSVYDRDTNADTKFDNSDLEALYISNIDGTNFVKLSKELHELYDFRILKSKLYFRTLEDINKDGKLNNEDKFHYYFVDFDDKGYNLTEHFPLSIFEQ